MAELNFKTTFAKDSAQQGLLPARPLVLVEKFHHYGFVCLFVFGFFCRPREVIQTSASEMSSRAKDQISALTQNRAPGTESNFLGKDFLKIQGHLGFSEIS